MSARLSLTVSAIDYAFRLAQLRAAFNAHRLHLAELAVATDAIWVEIEAAGLSAAVMAELGAPHA